MTNPMTNDFLAFLPMVAERLQGVAGLKKVAMVKELAELGDGKITAPLDGFAYLILDSYAPDDEAKRGKNQAVNVVFDVLLAKQHYGRGDVGDVGKTLTAICQALMGYEPMTADGRHLTVSPIYLNRGAGVVYQKGFALYPLRFTTQVVIMANEP